MIKLAKIHVIGFMIVSLIGSAEAQSVKECIQLALEKNATVLAARQNMEMSAHQASSTFRSTLPSIDFDAGYSHVTDVAEVEFPSIPPAPPRAVQLGVFDSYEAGITLNYAIFNGFANRAKISSSRVKHLLSESGLRKTEKEIAFRVITLYRQVQTVDLNIAALHAAKKRIIVQKNRIETLLENGLALPVDTLSLALAVLRFEQKIITSMALRKNIKNSLSMLVNEDVDIKEFRSKPGIQSISPYNQEKQEALKAIRLQQRLQKDKKKLSRSAYFPKINLQAAVKYGKPGVDVIENEWMTYGLVGVGLRWNIWRWGARGAAIQADEAAYRETLYLYEALEDELKSQYDSALNDLESVKEQLHVSEKALEVAEEKMRLIKEQAEQGMVSTSEFNEANLELSQAEFEYKKHQVLIAQKRNEIDYLSGKPINEWSL